MLALVIPALCVSTWASLLWVYLPKALVLQKSARPPMKEPYKHFVPRPLVA